MATYPDQVVRWDEAVAKGPAEMPRPAGLGCRTAPPAGTRRGYESCVPQPGIYTPYGRTGIRAAAVRASRMRSCRSVNRRHTPATAAARSDDL